MSFRAALPRFNALSLLSWYQNTRRVPTAMSSLQPAARRQLLSAFSANFSTTSEKKWYNPLSMMSLDQESQFVKQMEDIGSKSSWNLGVYNDQLSGLTGSIRAKVTGGMFGSQEIKDAKKSQQIAESLIKVAGKNADAKALRALGRIDLLKAANDAGITVEKLQEEIQKFDMTSTIHRLLRYLKQKGMETPKSSEEMRQLMQLHGPRMLSKKEKRMMEKQMKEKMKNSQSKQ